MITVEKKNNKKKVDWKEVWRKNKELLSAISVILSILSCGIAVFALLN